MQVQVLNGSPRKHGMVAGLLRQIVAGLPNDCEVVWRDVCSLDMAFCSACMQCRDKGHCVLPEDDAHRVGREIAAADALVIGTPTHWGNMSAPLKLLLDRNVPLFMDESPSGIPKPQQRGKPAALAIACTTPWPLNFLLPESRGAARAVSEVLHYGGYRIVGKVVRPGSKNASEIPDRLGWRARRLGSRLGRRLLSSNE